MTIVRDSPYSAKDDERLMADLWSEHIKDNPYNFVMYVFPWGKKGTPLENFKGPRKWQQKELKRIADHIAHNKYLISQGKPPVVYQLAVSSGRGVGKSSLVAWVTLWMMSCHLGSTTVVTANTETQLKTRTWAEMGKWHMLSINAHWFIRSSMAIKPYEWFEEALNKQLKIDTGYYYGQAQTWDEDNPDAFAGVHNHNGLLLVFDEASGIPLPIWTASEGFFTDPVLYRFYLVFSNPRRNTGPFFECFHKHRSQWVRTKLDARTVEGTDKQTYQKYIDKYGEDSDEVRVEVKGEFPRHGDRQFISSELVEEAATREGMLDPAAGLIMGVDIARFGADSTVIYFRRGRDARSIPHVEVKGLDNMQVADLCAEWIQRTDPDAVCIDAGNGTGVIDRLRALGYKVHEVWFGAKSKRPEYSNLRTELWSEMREWLSGGCIPADEELKDDLVNPEYGFQGSSDKTMLEPKEKMRKRGLSSPDKGDALACTFAVRVARSDMKALKKRRKGPIQARGMDYNLFGG